MGCALSNRRNYPSPISEICHDQRYSALLTALFASLMLSQAPAHADGLEDVVKRGT
jgi:hypothetical protein